nr:MAG: ORF1 [Torque teno midi virus]
MPFWWNRRKRPWFYNAYRRRRRYRWKRKPRRRLHRRRRTTKAYRGRRRRRRYKVRRKKQKLRLYQWQPEYIRRCKIRGLGALIIGAQGSQMDCYTIEKDKFVPPKVPWGGNSGIEVINLKYLYEEYTYKQNIWTASNTMLDLCRYIKCYITFFRHETTDFIISWNRQPPYTFDKYSIPSIHPQQLLLEKHKIVLLSKQSNPKGKYKKRVRINPPKQMLSKWFFTKQFAPKMLLVLKASAANMRYAYLSSTNDNMLTSIFSLNILFFQRPNWADASQATLGYLPYPNIPQPFFYVDKNGKDQTINFTLGTTSKYEQSISYEKGWFQPSFLQAREIKTKGSAPTAVHPITTSRYNPNTDDGTGNEVYLCSIFQSNWKLESDKQFTITGLPLWLSLYGYYSFIKQMKGESYMKLHVVCIKSKAIYCYPEVGSCQLYCPIDLAYIQGKKPYDQTITTAQKRTWYPDMFWQKETLNSIVQSGPYVPQYAYQPISTWELKYEYSFIFKWGGATQPEKDIKNPENLDTYDVPDTYKKTIQITNPEKQDPETIIHPWDYRRGIIKSSTLKRILEDASTDTEFQCSPEKISKKSHRTGAAPRDPKEENKEIQACLQTLFEENTLPEEEAQSLQQLINQQQQQQQQIKQCMLNLLIDLKKNQKMLQYHTGLLD